MTFLEHYKSARGTGLLAALMNLSCGVQAHEIIDAWGKRVGKPHEDPATQEIRMMFCYSENITEEEAINDCYNELSNLLREQFFGKLDRASCCALCNVLDIAGSEIAVVEGDPNWMLNSDRVAYEWNDLHPEEKPITKVHGDYPV